MIKAKRFIVIEMKHIPNAYCVDDTQTNKTKAVFYDEAAEELAKEFCKNINKAAGG